MDSILSNRLKNLREDADLKQHQLAEKLGVGRTTVAGYESGKIPNPPVDILIKYADIFNTSIDYLCGRTNNINSSLSSNDKVQIEHDKTIKYTDKELEKIEQALKILIQKRGEK